MTVPKTVSKLKSKTEAAPQKPAAFIFGARPKHLTGDVKFQSVTGVDVDIACTFKYRDREEFGAFWDTIADAKLPELPEGEKFTFERLAKQGIEVQVDRTMEFLTDWPIDLEFNRENVLRLFREEPAAPAAIWEAYRAACTEGRLGNSKPQ